MDQKYPSGKWIGPFHNPPNLRILSPLCSLGDECGLIEDGRWVRIKNHLTSNAFRMNSMSRCAQACGSTLEISLKKKDLNLCQSFFRQLQACRKSIMCMETSYLSSSLIQSFQGDYQGDLWRWRKTRTREQSITSLSFRKLTFYSITANMRFLSSQDSPSKRERNSLLTKFSSLPKRKSLQSLSSTNLPSQYPLMSKSTASPWPRLGMSRKMSSHLLALEVEWMLTTPYTGTSMDGWVSLNCLYWGKMALNRSRSSLLMVLRQQRLDLERAISLLRLPIISDGISSHSLNSPKSYTTDGPFSSPCRVYSSQMASSHWQEEPSLILNQNVRGSACRRRRVASMSLRWRMDLICLWQML